MRSLSFIRNRGFTISKSKCSNLLSGKFEFLAIFLLFLMCASCVASSANAQLVSYHYVTQYGSVGTGSAQFTNLESIAASRSGTLYVTDSGDDGESSRAVKISPSNLVIGWNIFDSTAYNYSVITSDLSAIATDSAGNVYVASKYISTEFSDSIRIQKFDANGNYISSFGGFGPGTIMNQYVYALTVDKSGNIYAAVGGYYNGARYAQIDKFNSGGVLLSSFGSKGSGNGQFENPTGIAVDNSGNIYVSDWSGNSAAQHYARIEKFNSAEKFLTSFGPEPNVGGLIEQFNQIAVDTSGNVYAPFIYYNLELYEGINQMVDCTAGVAVYNSAGTWINGFGSFGSNAGQFGYPVGVALDGSGNVYVADSGNYYMNSNSFSCCVDKFTAQTNPTPTPTVSATSTSKITPASTPTTTQTSTPIPTATPTATPTTTATPPSSASPIPTPTTVSATTANGAIVNLPISGNVTSAQMSNITIATNPSAETTTVSFTVTGTNGTTGFSSITIPKNALIYGDTPTIYIDGQQDLTAGYTQDNNNYHVWYTTHFSTHDITIMFTTASNPTPSSTSPSAPTTSPTPTIPEVTDLFAIIVLTAATSVVAIIINKRRSGRATQLKLFIKQETTV